MVPRACQQGESRGRVVLDRTMFSPFARVRGGAASFPLLWGLFRARDGSYPRGMTDREQPDGDESKRDAKLATYTAYGIPFGLVAGVIIGTLTDTLSMWIALGLSLGIVGGGVAYSARRSTGKDSSDAEE